MKVVILGCGPAGLFAAHAAVERGHEVTIFSKPRKSFMRGAQYLHRPIPGLSGRPFQVTYDLFGPVEGYRQKVYGDTSDVLVSPETLVGVAQAWDIREAYDAAWERYNPLIRSWDFKQGHLLFPHEVAMADMVFSTVPARLICERQSDVLGRPPMATFADGKGFHSFRSAHVWVTDRIKPSGSFQYEDGGPIDNLVLCSGDPDDWWYRASRIHGWENTEYPHNQRPPKLQEGEGVWEVEKPISTDCDCFPGIVRLGRYGSWTKGVLSHEAYYTADQKIEQRELKRVAQW